MIVIVIYVTNVSKILLYILAHIQLPVCTSFFMKVLLAVIIERSEKPKYPYSAIIQL